MTLRDKRLAGTACGAVLSLALLAAMPSVPAHADDAQNSTNSSQAAPSTTKPAILVPDGNATSTTDYSPGRGFPDKAGDLSGMMVVIPQKEMAEFSTPGGDRHLDRVSRAEAGASLAIKLVFTGVKADANGVANLTYDLKITGPDGKLYSGSDYHSLPALIGQIAPGDGVYDNRDKVVLLQFEPGDPQGAYKIEAVLHDRIAKVDLPLQTSVVLVPKMVAPAPEPAAAASSSLSQSSDSSSAAASSQSAAPPAVKTRSKRHKS